MSKNIAIITGATGGIGKEFIKQILDNKEVKEVWAIARNIVKLEELKAEFGEKIVPISADLSQSESYDIIKDKLKEDNPRVVYLVNNAGAGRMDPSTTFSDKYIKEGISTHCIAVAVLCNACIPYMNKGCHIINVASQSAFQPVPYINLYASSKVFTHNYSRALNVELKGTGITVTVVCPGWVKTELLEKERNGHKIKFRGITTADLVVKKTLSDVKKGKDVSVYGAYVKFMHFISKVCPQRLLMKAWIKEISIYI